MKNTIFLFLAAFFITATVNAQTTVDSIRAKYKLQPMPEALTAEKSLSCYWHLSPYRYYRYDHRDYYYYGFRQ